MGSSASPAMRAVAGEASDSTFGINYCRSANGHRLAATGSTSACQCCDGIVMAATGSAHRPRTGAYSPPRLPDQSPPGSDRDVTFLSSCRLVGLAPDSAGTGTLL